MIDQILEFSTNHWEMVAVFFFVLAAVVFVEMRGNARGITTASLTDLVNNKNAAVIDIRPTKEFRAGHITGAINIPANKLKDKNAELEKHKSNPIILVCKTGMTAGSNAKELIKAGFEVYKLQGGIAEWENANLPLVKA
ncbi:rhodanese-like domain-containing protein [Marinomonas mediterranea]|jgi:Rhodanese-related sulfurtransferase|uniref:Rhodanese-like protein n=1 Tax=Marinomonas mediterranea (strain ATCC 700492 / JCM 21426 / NBRC 103028 / MMB-1) TaxID=717774 RepID=F2JUE1_MARM1|nr:rhodanese-like domain-containing protein [Marinomonas mediterranea]ADZ92760.1 Rhodanese-like protein [Marinomonas mediterranea MMB-1]WCN10689.1 rhodanese-like domain-containing protein [Marinomonas mediterranea]WCN14746.1 rhodanese-like domain-containing protein [Marinomonas mediterranea]WCN18787.1 rhodanese-like domain-containing protein [Marinomonas mediterranea MMB-1]